MILPCSLKASVSACGREYALAECCGSAQHMERGGSVRWHAKDARGDRRTGRLGAACHACVRPLAGNSLACELISLAHPSQAYPAQIRFLTQTRSRPASRIRCPSRSSRPWRHRLRNDTTGTQTGQPSGQDPWRLRSDSPAPGSSPNRGRRGRDSRLHAPGASSPPR